MPDNLLPLDVQIVTPPGQLGYVLLSDPDGNALVINQEAMDAIAAKWLAGRAAQAEAERDDRPQYQKVTVSDN